METEARESFFCWLTGAKKAELPQVIYSFAGLFFLLFSYYLLKPIRTEQVLSEFDADTLPMFFLFVAFISFVLTKCFNYFSDLFSKRKLIAWTYVWVVACKLLFIYLLGVGGKSITTIFYIWSAVYFLLSLAIFWACTNDVFSSEQSKRCYGFIMAGATSGAFIGSFFATRLIAGGIGNWILLISAVSIILSLFLILKADRVAIEQPEIAPSESQKNNEKKRGILSELTVLAKHKYLRGIAVIVFCLAVFNTAFYFQSQKVIDIGKNKELYHVFFQDFEKVSGGGHFEFVLKLKSVSEEERESIVQKYFEKNNIQMTVTQFLARYLEYKAKLKNNMRVFFANTHFYTNLFGIILLLFFSRFVFQKIGVRFAVLICPLACLVIGIWLFFPVSLEIVQVMIVIGSALNYTLNNVTKEILYVPAGKEANFRFKPVIEGPCMRMGDAFTASLKLGLIWWFGKEAYSNPYMITVLILVVFWLFSGWHVSGQYKKHDDAQQDSDKKSEEVLDV
jgi:ATP/ADP translocase